ncbi:MAG: hypothetical protein JWN32_2660 [Solirubrobacterales bacterium]|nr:hypothetical protein [Solirubrobacterales bacterium]
MLRAAAGALSLSSAYLLTLLVAAAARRPRAAPEAAVAPAFLVLVPAHDEEAGLGSTLAALRALDYAPDRYELLVIADNCTDATADIARDAGATVLVRDDPEHRGKGAAIAWALDRALPTRPDVEAIALVDADCLPSPNLLTAMGSRLAAGAAAVQVAYTVSNPDDSPATALRYAGFALVNVLRPRGKSALGLSCGLFGTGMAFRRDLLARVPWVARSLAEDAEQHLELVDAGAIVAFAPEAQVTSPMPVGGQAVRDQQLRWEGGRVDIVRRWVPRLAVHGVSRRDPQRLHAALEQLVPPQSLSLAAHAALALAAVASRDRTTLRLLAASAGGQVVYVLGGLAVVRAPRSVFLALAAAPALVARKLGIYGRLLSGRGPTAWRRTARDG